VHQKPDTSTELQVVCVDFADAARLGDAIATGQAVRVILNGERQAMRRIVDFCTGAAAVTGRRLERLADDTYVVHA
jgi:FtsZ-interacting cell division protein YlmF